MSQFTFNGDLHGTRKPQLDFIGKILEKNGFKGSKVIIEPVGQAGDNYMANIKRIIANENGKTLKMIAKLAPENPSLRELAKVGGLYGNEHFVYTEVFPRFEQKQKEAGIPEHERFRFPKHFGSFMEAPNEVILLEDLKECYFTIMNRFEPLTSEYLKMVLGKFAMYNALSFAMRYQNPETYAIFQKQFAPFLDVETWNDDHFKQYFNQLTSYVVEVCDIRCHKVINGLAESVAKNERKILNMAKNSKYTVIQHGDSWINNIMFRFENDVPVESMMIDYQMVKENSPVVDLMYVLFNSTTHAQRSKHFHEYIDHYHNELDKALHNFGLKANFVYPRDRLDADMKIYGKLIFASSLFMSAIVTKNAEEAEKVREIMETEDLSVINGDPFEMMKADVDSTSMFKARVEGLVDSFTEFGLI